MTATSAEVRKDLCARLMDMDHTRFRNTTTGSTAGQLAGSRDRTDGTVLDWVRQAAFKRMAFLRFEAPDRVSNTAVHA